MKNLPSETDFIVVGAGIAGLRASVELASAGRVLCLAKREVTESNTQYAQGGIAAALSDDDEVGLHLEDTLKAGDGLVNEDAARILVEEGPPRIEELIEWGTEFDRTGTQNRLHPRRRAQPQPRSARARRFHRPRDWPRALSQSRRAEEHHLSGFRIHHRVAGERRHALQGVRLLDQARPDCTRSTRAPCCSPPAAWARFTATPPIPL